MFPKLSSFWKADGDPQRIIFLMRLFTIFISVDDVPFFQFLKLFCSFNVFIVFQKSETCTISILGKCEQTYLGNY